MRFEDGFAACGVWTLVTLEHDTAMPGSRHDFILTLSRMAGFQTFFSKRSERGVKLNLIFFKGASTTKRFARSKIFRYGCLMIFFE